MLLGLYKKYIIIKVLVIVLYALLQCTSSATSFLSSSNEITVAFFYTNDVHGRVSAYKAHRLENQPMIGGAQALTYYLNREIEKLNQKNIPYFIFDAGDFFQGTPESNLTDGLIMVEILNYLNFDVLTMGNHEFDWGMEKLQNLIEATDNTQYLSANLVSVKGNYLYKVKPYTIIERNEAKIGVIGLTTTGLFDYSAGDLNNYVDVLEYEKVLPKYLEILKNENVDLKIVVGHTSTSDNIEFAKNIRNIDIIFGGHNHSGLNEPILVPGTRTIVCQNEAFLQTLGLLKVTYDKNTNKILYYENELIPLIITEEVLNENEIEELLRPWTEEISQRMDLVIGETTITISRRKNIEGAEPGLGNFLTDILRKTYNTDIAVYNKTGIRDDLLKGEITNRSLFLIEPFDNTVYIVNFSGAELLEMLNYAFSNSYTYLDFSGMKVYYNPDLEDVITKVIIGNEEINLNKNYSVAVPNFIAGGGDGHLTFRNATDKYDTYDAVRDAFINYITEKKVIDFTYTQNLFNVK